MTLRLAAPQTRPPSRAWLVPAAAACRWRRSSDPTERFRRPVLVVAASDGVVLSIGAGQRRPVHRRREHRGLPSIAVFLSVFDACQPAPVAGRWWTFPRRGRVRARDEAEAEHNVAAYTVLATSRGRVVVAQRTGLIARRIVHRAPVGAMLARGERFGLIRFGSRTDVYLPAGAAEPLVAPDDRVRGGATPLARWR